MRNHVLLAIAGPLSKSTDSAAQALEEFVFAVHALFLKPNGFLCHGSLRPWYIKAVVINSEK
jgi:hypothetical protein